MAELVIPLTTTVVIVQNRQGIAVLQAAGHKPGVNVAAAVSGQVSMPMALIGNISTCLTGPTNALIVSGPHKERHYAAAMVTAVGAIAVGLFSQYSWASCWPCPQHLSQHLLASPCSPR